MPVRVLLVSDAPEAVAAWIRQRDGNITVYLAATHFDETSKRRLEELFDSPQPPPITAAVRRGRTSPPPS